MATEGEMTYMSWAEVGVILVAIAGMIIAILVLAYRLSREE
jgi:hypothetical protein